MNNTSPVFSKYMEQKSKPSVFIFLPSLRGGGAERSMLRLAQVLSRDGYATSLVLVEKCGPYLEQLDGDIEIIDLQSSRVIKSLPALTRLLFQRRPDILISALDHANIIALLATKLALVKTRIIVSVRNTLSMVVKHRKDMRLYFMPMLMQFSYPYADRVVCISQGVANDLIKCIGLDSRLIEVIYNPVINKKLIEQARLPIKHPWFEPNQPPVILGVGRLTRQKDFPTLIRAFAILCQQQEAHLMILGEGEDRSNLQHLVDSLGLTDVIQLPGFAANPFTYMSKSSVFVLSSAWEGLGVVLIEALACGTPVVSTDCPNGPREILADGKYGILVPVGNERALASAIAITLQHKRDIPADALEPYHDTVATSRYQALINTILYKG